MRVARKGSAKNGIQLVLKEALLAAMRPQSGSFGLYSWERPRLPQSPEMARPGVSAKNAEKKIQPRPEIPDPPENTPKIRSHLGTLALKTEDFSKKNRSF